MAVRAVETGTADYETASPPTERIHELVTRYAAQTHPVPQAATFAINPPPCFRGDNVVSLHAPVGTRLTAITLTPR